MFPLFKLFLKRFPVPLSRNHRYDLLTKKIIRQCCNENSNCVDVGAHRGEVAAYFVKYAPGGMHYIFEPLPFLYQFLKKKFQSTNNCKIYPIALSDKKESASFNYVISNPAYSGLKKRRYDRRKEKDTTIRVETDVMDAIIPSNVRIHFIKLDVEGGELNVLRGAQRILKESHPTVIFEFGIGGSDVYGATPERLFSFFMQFNYRIFLLEDFINSRAALTLSDLKDQFYHCRNYYFVAAYETTGNH